MNIVRCTNGHFFDVDSYQVCPHCGAAVAPSAPPPVPQQQKKGLFDKMFGKKHAQPLQEVTPPPAMPIPQSYAQPISSQSQMPVSSVPVQSQSSLPQMTVPNQSAPNAFSNSVPSSGAPTGKVKNVVEHTMDFWDANTSESTMQGELQIQQDQVPQAVTDVSATSQIPQVPVQEVPVTTPVSVSQVPVNPSQTSITDVAPSATIAPLPAMPAENIETAPVSSESSLAEAVKMASANSTGKTLSYFSALTGDESGNETGSSKPAVVDPVVGWLICIRGAHLGESFTIYAGANSIGRDRSNRIILSREGSVSRSKHAIITYEPKHRKFYIKPGESSGLTYINDEYITESRLISAKDVIELGDSKFLLIPLCGDEFTWEEYIKGRD